MPVRIYDIAKKLGIESKEVLAKAKELGIPGARVPSSSLDKITAGYLEENLAGSVAPQPEPPPPPPPEPIVLVTAPPEPVEPPPAEPAVSTPVTPPEFPPAEPSGATTIPSPRVFSRSLPPPRDAASPGVSNHTGAASAF